MSVREGYNYFIHKQQGHQVKCLQILTLMNITLALDAFGSLIPHVWLDFSSTARLSEQIQVIFLLHRNCAWRTGVPLWSLSVPSFSSWGRVMWSGRRRRRACWPSTGWFGPWGGDDQPVGPANKGWEKISKEYCKSETCHPASETIVARFFTMKARAADFNLIVNY